MKFKIIAITFYLFSLCLNAQIKPILEIGLIDFEHIVVDDNRGRNVFNNTYRFCDEDADGFMEIHLQEIEEEVLYNNGLSGDDNESIYVSTNFGGLIKINNPSGDINVELICDIGFPMTDVGVDPNENIFVTTYTSISELDQTNCNTNAVLNYDNTAFVNSLSFDPSGNMYFGLGSESVVYRDDVGGDYTPYVWHDFGEGVPGGDFVLVDDKLYIAWNVDETYYLFEVILDNDFSYVSHEVLFELPENTFGLASELGKLYGVNPEMLYEIDLELQTIFPVLQNTFPFGEWWGAAGLHESVSLEVSSYFTMNEAENGLNPLPEYWTNTQQGGQTIFIRIENTLDGTYVILPIEIIIFNKPQTQPPNDLSSCSDASLNVFDLTEVEIELLVNNNVSATIDYFLAAEDATANTNAIVTNFQTTNQIQTIYVRVTNENWSDCYSIENFQLINLGSPDVAKIVMDPEARLLESCYIDRYDMGYFKLEEIYDVIVLDGADNYTLNFYNSFEDAENDSFRLPTTYESSIGDLNELFVRVTDENGCYKITNFFIDGNCLLTTEDLSGLTFPRFFTPNQDGYNDLWNVRGISNKVKMQATITIIDRYGKTMTTFNPKTSTGWDGLYNGNKLFSNDYWFSMHINNGRTYRGHFTLKR